MLTCFLFIEVIPMNIETKSITLYDKYDLHPMEGIVENNRHNIAHWLMSTMELYVDTSTISVNGQHVLCGFL